MSIGNPPFLTFLRAFVPFGFMGAMTYSFANPDEDNVYDIFPVQKSKYSFITGYKVKQENRVAFEKSWRDLARYYQGQEGYLFNKLIREDVKEGDMLYLDFNQWTNGDSFRIAASKSLRDKLFSALHDHCEEDQLTFTNPMMYKSVVDDTQFTPSEVINARKNSNLPVSMNSQ